MRELEQLPDLPRHRGSRLSALRRRKARPSLRRRRCHRYYDVGLEHLAFEVDTREEVDAAYERCLRRGDRIRCPPEEDSDIPGYYAFFVFDPDGFRIEVFSPKPEWSSRIHGTSQARGQQNPSKEGEPDE